jgi:hypothetical protein
MSAKEIIVEKKEKLDKADISLKADLFMCCSNLANMEEHIYFTYVLTRNEKYLQIYNMVRKIRGKLLKKLIKNDGGEVWCFSKHNLVSFYRLIEVGTKALSSDNLEEAKEYFDMAYDVYKLFWLVQEIK